ncbi:MAG TPA: carbon starvation protein A [Terriglobia bacterium]|nr:carbon starvation protein A [Terriglobia bacterium]
MNALPLMLGVLCFIAIGYRYYSAFIATKVLILDDSRQTPAHRLYDGQNYFPTNKWVLFGHHFAAITGAGPLIGPVLATQFGFLPGLLWLVVGVVLAGAVHDFIILFASVRSDGKSLAEIAKKEISPVAGFTAAVAILFIVIIALAGLGLAVVNALRESSWGTFTIAATIPIALFMGLYMYRFRKGKIREATVIGVIALIAAVVFGKLIPGSPLGPWFTLSKNEITVCIAIYGLAASILPVWMLLCPRDYLSSFMKLGTIAFLIIGVFVVHPDLKMPAFSQFVDGGGPIIPGKMFPFVFITIACGAISGFHALVGSGTTPKMISLESHIRPLGYGSMLMEGVVGVVSLIAASALFPGDYFAINVTPEKFSQLGMSVVNLPELEREVGEIVTGRPGGAVSLAVGMAQIFTAIPGMKGLMSYWYHFAIMFEALFILTTIDTGTRVARFLVQEFLGKFYKPMEKTDWMPGTIFSSVLVVAGWSYFIFTGNISTIWPMFGIANQLLAGIALCVGTTLIINLGRARLAWVTLLPLSFVSTTTLTAGYLSITDNFMPLARNADSSVSFQGQLNVVLTIIMMTCMIIVLFDSMLKWRKALSSEKPGGVPVTG